MNPNLIIDLCAKEFFVTNEQLFSKTRTKNVASARQCAYYLFRKYCNYSYTEVGKVFNRDHSCVMHGVNAAPRDRLVDIEDKINKYEKIWPTKKWDKGKEIKAVAGKLQIDKNYFWELDRAGQVDWTSENPRYNDYIVEIV